MFPEVEFLDAYIYKFAEYWHIIVYIGFEIVYSPALYESVCFSTTSDTAGIPNPQATDW